MEILKIVNKWLKIVQRRWGHCLRLPSSCLLCLQPGAFDIICEGCEAALPWWQANEIDCRALFAYKPPLESFILKLKFQQALYFADWFARKMIEKWERPAVDLIIPVPLHPRRQQQRGFNQTLEIAKVLACYWKIPLDRWSCTRVHYTAAQSKLSARARKLNVTQYSFNISPRLKNKRVLLIEDVITTGTTINAFISALQEAGVRNITVWACCQTPAKTYL